MKLIDIIRKKLDENEGGMKLTAMLPDIVSYYTVHELSTDNIIDEIMKVINGTPSIGCLEYSGVSVRDRVKQFIYYV